MRGGRAALLVGVVVLAACGTAAPSPDRGGTTGPTATGPSPDPERTPAASPATSAPPPRSPTSGRLGPSAEPSPARSVGPQAVAAVDASLLDILPPDVDRVPLKFSAEASAGAVAADLDPEIEALAFAIGAALPDLVIVSVVQLAAESFDDAFFRRWRDTYADGVCASAGGTRPGVAQVELGGRNVYVGSCVNGGHTYFVWLAERGVIVSAYSVGDRKLGERLMESLEE